MVTGPQAVAVSSKHLHRQDARIKLRPSDRLRSYALQGHHLSGDRLGVLKPCHSDAAGFDPKPSRQVRDQLWRGHASFRDAQIEMLSFAAWQVERTFLNVEVLRRCPNAPRNAGYLRSQIGQVIRQA